MITTYEIYRLNNNIEIAIEKLEKEINEMISDSDTDYSRLIDAETKLLKSLKKSLKNSHKLLEEFRK